MPSVSDMNSNEKVAPMNGRSYWRSLDELADTPEFRAFVKEKIPNKAFEMLDGSSRRRFLQIMAASFALAGLTGCRWPKEKIAPYASRPEGRTPGIPEHYATAFELGGVASGLLVTSFDGRPIKIEGNPQHPLNKGATRTIDQATVLELYDPDRSQTIYQRQDGQSFSRNLNQFRETVLSQFTQRRADNGRGLCFLSESTSSLTVTAMAKGALADFPEAKWYEYEPLNNDNERLGTQIALGQDARVRPLLEQAKVVLSLDADLFGTHPAYVQLAREYMAGKNPEHGHEMNRLYMVESSYTGTGALADHRLPIPATQILPFAVALAQEIIRQGRLNISQDLQVIINEHGQSHLSGFSEKFLQVLAKDLLAHQGASVVVAGANQPPALHALTCVLNNLLGNTGKTVQYLQIEHVTPQTSLEAIRELSAAMANGQVQTLVILGGNPVYDAPVDLEFSKHLAKVPNSIHLSLYPNETSQACNWQIPRAHYLESWGDCRAFDGTVSTIQPLIEPLYGGLTTIELLAMIRGVAHPSAYDIIRQELQPLLGYENFETAWAKAIQRGFIENTLYPALTPAVQEPAAYQAVKQELTRIRKPEVNSLEIAFVPDTKVYDGRFANNGWLQELPDFMTKTTWDNFALLSQKTAQSLGIGNGERIRLAYRGNRLEMAAYIMPGHAHNSVTLPLGYGRTSAGRVGNRIGFDTYALRTGEAMNIDTGLTITGTGVDYTVASTQDHHFIDKVGMVEREIRVKELIQEATVEDYLAHPEFAKGHEGHFPIVSLWNEWEYNEAKWGMAINLHTCIGCNACVVACQAENNIPIVGKEQVWRQREMHWLRIDRYFKGDAENPQVSHQPLACVHCENAPCEAVCPVGATIHDNEGINAMVYNRCVGTRYCSNNCPYKVRRFNFFNYHKNLSDTEKMVFNPEVTVRSRGIMEKCTYCTQRIESVKIKAKNEKRQIEDGEIVTACAQACPTRAIVFGDLNRDSEVRKLHELNRAYSILDELNTKPRTAYIARIRNINPELMDQETAHEHNSSHS